MGSHTNIKMPYKVGDRVVFLNNEAIETGYSEGDICEVTSINSDVGVTLENIPDLSSLDYTVPQGCFLSQIAFSTFPISGDCDSSSTIFIEYLKSSGRQHSGINFKPGCGINWDHKYFWSSSHARNNEREYTLDSFRYILDNFAEEGHKVITDEPPIEFSKGCHVEIIAENTEPGFYNPRILRSVGYIKENSPYSNNTVLCVFLDYNGSRTEAFVLKEHVRKTTSTITYSKDWYRKNVDLATTFKKRGFCTTTYEFNTLKTDDLVIDVRDSKPTLYRVYSANEQSPSVLCAGFKATDAIIPLPYAFLHLYDEHKGNFLNIIDGSGSVVLAPSGIHSKDPEISIVNEEPSDGEYNTSSADDYLCAPGKPSITRVSRKAVLNKLSVPLKTVKRRVKKNK